MSGETKDTQKGRQKEIDGEGGAIGRNDNDMGPNGKSLHNAKFNPFSCDNDVTRSSSLNNTNHNSTYTSYNNSCNNSAKFPHRGGQEHGQRNGQGQGHLEKYPPLITKPGLGPQSLPIIPRQGQAQAQAHGQYLRRSAKRQSGGYLSQVEVRYVASYDRTLLVSTLTYFTWPHLLSWLSLLYNFVFLFLRWFFRLKSIYVILLLSTVSVSYICLDFFVLSLIVSSSAWTLNLTLSVSLSLSLYLSLLCRTQSKSSSSRCRIIS